jgi:two-component system sensor histidine kinase TctE
MNFPMREKPLPTLRRRLLFFLILPLAVLLILSLVVDYRIAYEPANEAFDDALIDNVLALADRVNVIGPQISVDLPPAAEAILRTADENDEEFISIFGPDGRLLAGDEDLRPDEIQVARKPVVGEAKLRGKTIRKVSYRIDTTAGPVMLASAETIRRRERTGSQILAAMILPNVLLILATLVLVYAGVRNGLAPLIQLSKAIGLRAPRDLSPLPAIEVPGEAQPLVSAMNAMIEDLRMANQAQQAFLANAAHQLKTPLAALQTQLELTVTEIPGEYKNRIMQLHEATSRLGHLTHQLLALARSSPEAKISHKKLSIDLGKLLEASASTWFDSALKKSIELEYEPGSAVLDGVEWLIREMLGNLIDNAIRYTPRGGQVTVRSGVDLHGRPFIEVEDTGPGIPQDERERIFQRFYRADDAAEVGAGLGLAIVKEVADRHEADIEIADSTRHGHGTTFTVRFPVSRHPGIASGEAQSR